MDVDDIRRQLARRASLMVVGGFRPPQEPSASWFGRVRLALPGEVWPAHNEKPMLPLCQINCVELPHVPHALSDIALITVFITRDDLPIDAPNGDRWELRAYKSLEGLVEVAGPESDGLIKPFPVRWEPCEADYPCQDDVPVELPAEVDEKYYDLFENQRRSKVGGWPSLIQSEIYWAPWNKHPASPEYVFQIDSEEKAGWMWGDTGTGYFGRGVTGAAKDEWALAWQCY
jgi:uncharacterized protein YwqG